MGKQEEGVLGGLACDTPSQQGDWPTRRRRGLLSVPHLSAPSRCPSLSCIMTAQFLGSRPRCSHLQAAWLWARDLASLSPGTLP